MDISFSKEDEAWREEVRSFIAENYPKDVKAKQDAKQELTKEDMLAWHKILAKKGWAAPSWPQEWGGTDWTITQKFIFNEESAAFGTIPPVAFGVSMVGPVIYTFASEEQKKQHLPGIYNGDVWWSQGYSEPGAGSDLASLRTTAVRDGDHYIVNGQKTWTTLGQFGDWMFCLCRTDPNAKIQEGISFLLFPMDTPGVEVKPIITLEGGHEVNDVFLTDVRVPVENRVGEENKGWTYAKYLLAHERTGIAGVARSKKALVELKKVAAAEVIDGTPLSQDAAFSDKIVQLELDLKSLEMTELRTIAAMSKGEGPGPESSILKIRGSEIQQRLTELTVEAVGYYANPHLRDEFLDRTNYPIGPDYAIQSAGDYFNTRKTSIYGGSNEIQHNIIAKAILGL